MAQRIAFIHLDLGVGGAETLVVNEALALQQKGHNVTVFTAHHDPTHCHPATADGTLKIEVYGDWLPVEIFGRFHLLCALWRMFWVVFCLFVTGQRFDCVFNDQVSAINPFLHLIGRKSVFYGHFPDLLLCTERGSAMKRAYRYILDGLESRTTASADVVFVNSKFTADTFRSTFPHLRSVNLEVLYPPVDLREASQFLEEAAQMVEFPELEGSPISDSRAFLLSLNRYERKKNIGLAIEAYAKLVAQDKKLPALVIAGGYDPRVAENVEHHRELVAKAADLGVAKDVLFLRSIPNRLRLFLMREAIACIYTPHNEHFGIVPVEAMALKTPVIAVNSGGPTETVVDGKTGYLRNNVAEDFAEAIRQAMASHFGEDCQKRANEFGLDAFADRLDQVVRS